MKLLAHVHGYPPHHNAGAEYMLHTVLRWMQERGHDVRVIADAQAHPVGYEFEGIKVVTVSMEHYEWCDVAITHLDLTAGVRMVCRLVHKPLVHLVHNKWQLGYHGVTDADLVVFNTHWLQKEVEWPGGPSIAVHPPVWVNEYATTPVGDAITLVNLTVPKGVTAFLWLARHMRDRRFMGVRGGYGVQCPVPAPNIEYTANQPGSSAMRDEVYRRTRIVLMPSEYESYGRVAMEAAASGIPAIVSPTDGLKEALGPAGIYVDRKDGPGLMAAVKSLDDPDVYDCRSQAARIRARDQEDLAHEQLHAMERRILATH